MRIRTGHGPSDWRDDGPSSCSTSRGPGSNAVSIGDMRPVLTKGAVFERRHIGGMKRARIKAHSIHPENAW